MAGFVEELAEVMADAKRWARGADLSLIGAALSVEHYEIAASTDARNLAVKLHETAIVRLLTMSFGENSKRDSFRLGGAALDIRRAISRQDVIGS
jgi:Mn-containing catalase